MLRGAAVLGVSGREREGLCGLGRGVGCGVGVEKLRMVFEALAEGGRPKSLLHLCEQFEISCETGALKPSCARMRKIVAFCRRRDASVIPGTCLAKQMRNPSLLL